MNATAVKNKTDLQYLLLIALATYATYFTVFSAGFISWDDAEFTFDNRDVQDFNIKGFFTHFYLGNYPPFTMVSFAIDYYFGKNSSWIYHFTNINLHVINACLVFLLFKKINPNKYIALFVALIFAIHPMQTESVSWISERKNVLCGLFYLLTLILYLRYIKTSTLKNYIFVLLGFMAALFSKGMAVSLPITLLALDLWMNRSLTKKVFSEKISRLKVQLRHKVFDFNPYLSGWLPELS